MNRLTPTNALEFISHRVSEVHVDLSREALLHIAKDAEVVILRVQTFGPNGRPTSRTLRLPVSILSDPEENPFL